MVAGTEQPSDKIKEEIVDKSKESGDNINHDDAIKQIKKIHSPDGRGKDINGEHLLQIINYIIKQPDKISTASSVDVLEPSTYTIINTISCEMTCKCCGEKNSYETSYSIFEMVSRYSWEDKVLLTMAAFAVSYNDFFVLARSDTTNPLATLVAKLKYLPSIFGESDSLTFLKYLVESMLNVTSYIVKISKLLAPHVDLQLPEMTKAWDYLSTTAYWTINSVMACTFQINSSSTHGEISLARESWKRKASIFISNIDNVIEQLTKQFTICEEEIKSYENTTVFEFLVEIFRKPQSDNLVALSSLVGQKPLELRPEGSSKIEVGVDKLKGKNVMLIISGLDISDHYELVIVNNVYQKCKISRTKQDIQVVWFPIVNEGVKWDAEMERKFKITKDSMQWYTLCDPIFPGSGIFKLIKEKWKFSMKPIAVVLDPKGNITCENAFHMIYVWGIKAFPFTTNEEKALWNALTWGVEFLVDTIDASLTTWINDGNYICLFGGEDLDWVNKFINQVNDVGKKQKLKIKMVYMPNINPNKKMQERISLYFSKSSIQYFKEFSKFWVRLESMWHSKPRYGKNELLMKEVMKMISFGSSHEGWAVIGNKSNMAKANGEMFVTCFDKYEDWKDKAKENANGFIGAVNDYLKLLNKNPPSHHCNHILLPETAGYLPDVVECIECGRIMDKFVMYKCCTN